MSYSLPYLKGFPSSCTWAGPHQIWTSELSDLEFKYIKIRVKKLRRFFYSLLWKNRSTERVNHMFWKFSVIMNIFEKILFVWLSFWPSIFFEHILENQNSSKLVRGQIWYIVLNFQAVGKEFDFSFKTSTNVNIQMWLFVGISHPTKKSRGFCINPRDKNPET